MDSIKIISTKAIKSLHITLPIGSIVALIGFVIYATTYANKYEDRLLRIESAGVIMAGDVDDLNQAVLRIDKKFDEKFEGFQVDFKELLTELWRQK